MENNLNLTPELLEQAAKAPSAAALLALAQENGIDLTAEQAAVYYAQLHPEMCVLSDEELDNVSGTFEVRDTGKHNELVDTVKGLCGNNY